ncbi:transposase domain-containing protein [Asticcacaulis biprosthecium]|nr:transposase domain-containing protein [Asticcacaulis biprosthecium]
MDLPGLSNKRNRVVEMAASWAGRYRANGSPAWRKRSGRGGGFEYHHSVLPSVTVQALIARGLLNADLEAPKTPLRAAPEAANDANAWGWFDKQPDHVKAEAQARLKAVQAVDTQHRAGLSKSAAVALVAHLHEVSTSSLWGWLKLVESVGPADWLPALASRRKAGGVRSEVDPRILKFFKSFKLRPGRQGFEHCRRETVEYAKSIGLTEADVPCTKKLTRELRRTTSKRVIIAKTKGLAEVVKTIPPQIRTREHLHAMEAVNIDGHKWDVFVRVPNQDKPVRVISVMIQDLYSNKILAWRTGLVESAVLTRLAILDMCRNHGIPQHFTLDNGRAFASKWITGGAKTRFRFKVKEEEPLGILPALGIKEHWATPHHGQAKPIERMFGPLEEIVSSKPQCQGAWTGNKPNAKPEDYATKAVDIEVFEAILAEAVARYNAQTGRTGANAKGRSYDQTFADSLAAGAAVGRASAEQLRMCLLTAENVKANKDHGGVQLYGNHYHHDVLHEYAGQMLTVRFDPDNLHQPVEVYDLKGRHLATAEVRAAVGFYDAQGAQDRAKMNANLKKATREAIKIQELLSAADMAAAMPIEIPEMPATEPTVIRPVRNRGSAAARLAPVPAPDAISYRDRFTALAEQIETVEPWRKFQVFDGGLTPSSGSEGPKK